MVSEDNAWAIKRADAGKTLTLTSDDLGIDFTRKECVLLRQQLCYVMVTRQK